MSGQEHTPTPWIASAARKSSNFGNYIAFVQTADPVSVIAKVSGGVTDARETAEANAAFIVEAVNSHSTLTAQRDALVKALANEVRCAELQAGIMRDKRRTGGWDGAERVAAAFDRTAERCRAALSLVTPKGK